jgi:hypothetical protein
LAQAILKLVNQDDGGKNSQTITIIKNVVKSSSSSSSGGGDGDGKDGDERNGGSPAGGNICIKSFFPCDVIFPPPTPVDDKTPQSPPDGTTPSPDTDDDGDTALDTDGWRRWRRR